MKVQENSLIAFDLLKQSFPAIISEKGRRKRSKEFEFVHAVHIPADM